MKKIFLNYFLPALVHFHILLILGSFAIFYSWVVQNIDENNYKSQKENLLEKQVLVNHMFDARRVWLESIFTHRAIKNDLLNDDEIYFTKAYNYLETTLSTLSLINEITIQDSLERQNQNLKLASILELNKQYFKEKKYTNLIQTINTLNSEDQYNVNQKFADAGEYRQNLLAKITSNEEKATNRFLLYYIIGSILIAIDFLFSKIRTFKFNLGSS